jgi:hypothetical protein
MKKQKKGRDGKSSLPIETLSHGRGRWFKPRIAHHGNNKGVNRNRLAPFSIAVLEKTNALGVAGKFLRQADQHQVDEWMEGHTSSRF